MTTEPSEEEAAPTQECPAHSGRTPLYGDEFAVDPASVYSQLRQHGPIAPVDIAPGTPANLVLSYDAALDVLRSPETFPKDPRQWQRNVPADCPVLPMMRYRPHCLFTDGATHARLRKAVSDSMSLVDAITVRRYVEEQADRLIDEFAPTGEADLLSQYARRVPLLVLIQLFGCPPELAERMAHGMGAMLDGVNAEQGNIDLSESVAELVALKRGQPGPDVTSWLIADPAEMTDEEVREQITLLMGAGIEPEQNLIANALRLLLSDKRFAGDLSGGSMPVDEALDEVLWADPPLSNWGITHPPQDAYLGGIRVPAGEPVVISFSAANNDPAIDSGQRAGNRAHLAWSAGPHTCPTRGLARLIASVAIERLLDRVPDLDLAVPVEELRWRPGPFHRALTALPARFPPISVAAQPDRASSPRADGPASTAAASSAPEPTPETRESRAPGWVSSWLVKWWRGGL